MKALATVGVIGMATSVSMAVPMALDFTELMGMAVSVSTAIDATPPPAGGEAAPAPTVATPSAGPRVWTRPAPTRDPDRQRIRDITVAARDRWVGAHQAAQPCRAADLAAPGRM